MRFEDQKTALAWRDQLGAMCLDASCVADRPLVAVVSVASIGLWSTTVLLAERTLVLVCGRSRPLLFLATSGVWRG